MLIDWQWFSNIIKIVFCEADGCLFSYFHLTGEKEPLFILEWNSVSYIANSELTKGELFIRLLDAKMATS